MIEVLIKTGLVISLQAMFTFYCRFICFATIYTMNHTNSCFLKYNKNNELDFMLKIISPYIKSI